MKSIQIKVNGKVQGVWYRKFTKQTADKLGIIGSVKNCTDGSVFIHAQGSAESLDRLIEFCKVGPENAKVTGVYVKDALPQIMADFRIIS